MTTSSSAIERYPTYWTPFTKQVRVNIFDHLRSPCRAGQLWHRLLIIHAIKSLSQLIVASRLYDGQPLLKDGPSAFDDTSFDCTIATAATNTRVLHIKILLLLLEIQCKDQGRTCHLAVNSKHPPQQMPGYKLSAFGSWFCLANLGGLDLPTRRLIVGYLVSFYRCSSRFTGLSPD